MSLAWVGGCDMKLLQVQILLVILVLVGCNDKDAYDCIKKTGRVNEYKIELTESFDRLHITSNIDVDLVQGGEQEVLLITGENLVDEIEVVVENGELVFQNNNTCNWAREYGVTRLKITTPELSQVVFESGGTLRSMNTLSFPDLVLDSKESSGDYILDIDMDSLKIITKRISNFYITGKVNELNLDFQTGDGRFYGENLIAQNITFYHNGTNDVMVYPVQSLQGTIDRYGNVIYYNEPMSAPNVETMSKGRLVRGF